jgi:hypothetical protein
MKKFVILLFCMIAYHCNILADEKIEIELGVEIIDDTPTHPAPGKAPIRDHGDDTPTHPAPGKAPIRDHGDF